MPDSENDKQIGCFHSGYTNIKVTDPVRSRRIEKLKTLSAVFQRALLLLHQQFQPRIYVLEAGKIKYFSTAHFTDPNGVRTTVKCNYNIINKDATDDAHYLARIIDIFLYDKPHSASTVFLKVGYYYTARLDPILAVPILKYNPSSTDYLPLTSTSSRRPHLILKSDNGSVVSTAEINKEWWWNTWDARSH